MDFPDSWSWKDFCGRDDFVVWNRDFRDFDICFQYLFFHIPILSLIAILSAYYSGALQCHIRRVNRETWILRIRYSLSLILAGLPVAKVYILETLFPGQLHSVDFLVDSVQCIAWIVHFCYLITLSNHLAPSLRGPLAIGVIWTINYILCWINLHSSFLISQKPYSPISASNVFFYFSTIQVVVQTFYLFTLFPQGNYYPQYEQFQSIGRQSGEQSPVFGYSRFREDMDSSYLGYALEGASTFTRLSFSWVNPLIAKGVSGQLHSSEDLFDLPDSLTSFRLYDNLQKKLRPANPYLGRNKKTSLLKGLHLCFWKEFYGIGILKFTSDICGFCGPLLLNRLVKFVENKNEPIYNGYIYSLGLCITSLVGAVCISHYNFLMKKVGLKIRGSLMGLIYRKILKVNSANISHLRCLKMPV